MISWTYWLIVVFILGLVIWNLYREKNLGFKITAVMVAIPLLLRVAGLK